MAKKQIIDQANIESMVSATVLDLANNQYSVQWTKIGNLQTSAGSLLTLISLVAAVVLGVVSNSTALTTYMSGITPVNIAFYISVIMSLLYMILASIFMFLILRSKKINIMQNPVYLHTEIMKQIRGLPGEKTETEMILHANTYLVNKINDEIDNTDAILNTNRFWYGKCLTSSFLSLFGSILALLFVNSNLFKGDVFYTGILSIFSY